MANALTNSKSPYLQQHQYNPVNWMEWSEAVFQLAKAENKPVFLSIGYSTCHWCHVMAHESFEDSEIADLLNQSFISIKVDREERPDIDKIYMEICQAMHGHGGWPLSLFLTPQKEAFYSATYIPKEDRHGRLGMKSLLGAICNAWDQNQTEIRESVNVIMDYLKRKQVIQEAELKSSVIETCVKTHREYFDYDYGGFSFAPKFPSVQHLLFLSDYSQQFNHADAKEMIKKTCDEMRFGGLFDQVGYGFHRYATDRKWLVPHFEKMLYDQAMLIMAYSHAFVIFKDPLYHETVNAIIHYCNDKLLSPEGAYYCGEDADSESVEGKFYLWTAMELKNILSENEFNNLKQISEIETRGNFIDEHSGIRNSANSIHIHSKNHRDLKSFLAYRDRLYRYRETRVKPSLDNKILLDWNALLASAMAQSAKILQQERYFKYALNILQFCETHFATSDGLKRRYYKGETGIDANLDDVAFLIKAYCDSYSYQPNLHFLKRAVFFCNYAIEQFWDYQNGGFYFSAINTSDLISRSKELQDGAIPSSNAIMLENLIYLYHVTADFKYKKLIDKELLLYAGIMNSHSIYCSYAVKTLIHYFYPVKKLILRTKSSINQELIHEFQHVSLSCQILVDDAENHLVELAEYLQWNTVAEDTVDYFLCEGFSCQAPTKDKNEIIAKLQLIN